MSQQQPGWGAQPQHGQHPTQWGAPPPQPPKKKSAGKIVGLGCLGVVALFVIIGIGAAIGGGGGNSTNSSDTAGNTSAKPKAKDDAKKDKPATSQAQQFKDCVAGNGTATEKAAVKHVIKVSGADKTNNILDAPEVFTDYTGGMLGPHASDGKLIASAFASCYESENGLVTVYDKDGELLSNGNF